MPEASTVFRNARDLAVAQLDAYLINEHKAERLHNPIGIQFNKSVAAWKVNLSLGGESFDLAIIARSQFPFAPPEIHFITPGAFLRFPHVDQDGKLCITNAATTFSPRLVVETAKFLLSEVSDLIIETQKGTTDHEFILEFRDYWRRLPTYKNGKPFWSILDVRGPTRLVWYYAATGFTLFAESAENLRVWMKNYCGGDTPKGFNARPTVLIWLPKPLHPRDYPKAAREIQTLAQRSSGDADNILSAAIPKEPGRLPIMLGFDTSAGVVLGGVDILEPTAPKSGNFIKQRNCRNDGFRAGHMPTSILVRRYLGTMQLSLFDAIRVDAEWCLYRGGSEFSKDLFAKKIAVIGCGSVGADVAGMLARAGVGNFVLIDDDFLSWGNVARHYLGGSHVGENKAPALACEMARQMPWLKIESYVSTIEALIEERMEALRGCDLIVSTTANWGSECMLNAAIRTLPRMPPVLFGWTEAFGICGHALAVLNTGGCLACGMSEFGVFRSRVSAWPKGHEPLLQATGCSDLFQPYTTVDVAPIKAMIAELALEILRGNVRESVHRTWVGDIARLNSIGGSLQGVLKDQITAGVSDKRLSTNPWPVNLECPLHH